MPLLCFRYGAHLSREQVADLVAPHPGTLELVISWLGHHDIPSSSVARTHGGGWLTVTKVPVSKADDLLGASYQLYRYTGTNETVVILRTVGYSLPATLHDLVQAVAPTTYFDSPHLLQQTLRKRSRGEEAAAMKNATSSEGLVTVLRREDNFIKPEILRSLYQTIAYVPAAADWDKNVLGVVGFSNLYPNPTDLTAFMSAYRTDAVAATFNLERVNNGGYNPDQPDTEANGNIQYTAAIAFPTPQIFYSVGGTPMWLGPEDDNKPEAGDVYLEWLNYILKLEKIPQTINISYGSSELTIPEGYAASLCDLFKQLGARGVSVLVASGDDGVGHGDCIAEDGNVYFNIQFPASCKCGVFFSPWDQLERRHNSRTILPRFAGPWVTSVGGTTRGSTSDNPETVSEIAASISQGGFSYFFARPPYQDSAVTAFLRNLGDTYSGLYKCARCCDLARAILTL